MARQPWPPSQAELERALADLGSRIEYPSTPDLTGSVGAALRARGGAPRPLRRTFRGGALLALLAWRVPVRSIAAAGALVLALVAVLAIFPSTREAVADWIGIRGIVITHEPNAPAHASARLGASLRLGDRVTLQQAQQRVPFPIVTPSPPELGSPDEVYLGQPPPSGQVSLVYHARPGLPAASETGVGLLLTQFRGDLAPGFFGKGLGPDTRIERVSVNGQEGFWIEGRAHLFYYRDADGDIYDETIRLAGNVLLWERGDLTLRLESALPKEEALRIAESVR